jgi:ribonuclease E
MVSAALPMPEAEVLSEQKTSPRSNVSTGQEAIESSDPTTETAVEAVDGESTAASLAAANRLAGRRDQIYPIQEPAPIPPAPIPPAPTLLLADASPGVREVKAVATESEEPDRKLERTDLPLSQAAEKPAHLLEPLNLVESGLIMIETIPGKLNPADGHASEESIPANRRKRKPVPPRVTVPDAPLVQIETHK